MVSRQGLSRLLALLVVASLFLVACERPFPREDTPETPAGADNGGEDTQSPYPGDDGGDDGGDAGYPGDPGDGGDAGGDDSGDAGDDAGYPGDPGDGGDDGGDAGGDDGDTGDDGDVGGDPGDSGDGDVGGGAPGDGGDPGDGDGGDGGDNGDAGDAGDDAGDDGDAGDTGDDAGDTGGTEPVIHTVQVGENLYRIGLQYGISWLEIAALNNIPPPYTIKVGDQLLISAGTTDPGTPPDDDDTTSYVVQPGDNLFRIGLQFGISWRQIAEANGIVNPNSIRVGQVLKIPTSTPGPGTEFNHVVQRGETLFRISLQYGVSWQAIAERNNIASPYVIYPGETLIIPSN